MFGEVMLVIGLFGMCIGGFCMLKVIFLLDELDEKVRDIIKK